MSIGPDGSFLDEAAPKPHCVSLGHAALYLSIMYHRVAPPAKAAAAPAPAAAASVQAPPPGAPPPSAAPPLKAGWEVKTDPASGRPCVAPSHSGPCLSQRFTCPQVLCRDCDREEPVDASLITSLRDRLVCTSTFMQYI